MPVVLNPEVQAAKDLITQILAEHKHLIARIGLKIPDGWSSPVAEALQAIVELEKAAGQKIKIAQIKEKFAGLRFYASVANTEDKASTQITRTPLGVAFRPAYKAGTVSSMLQNITQTAEEKASKLCQICGQPGVMRAGGWLFRSCDAHSSGAAEFVPPRRVNQGEQNGSPA